jgi:hypothetical protein
MPVPPVPSPDPVVVMDGRSGWASLWAPWSGSLPWLCEHRPEIGGHDAQMLFREGN